MSGCLPAGTRVRASVLSGRGNLIGLYENAGMFFLAATFNWKL